MPQMHEAGTKRLVEFRRLIKEMRAVFFGGVFLAIN